MPFTAAPDTQAPKLRHVPTPDAFPSRGRLKRVETTALLNLIWPSPRRRDVGPAGTFGRVVHWLGVIAAVVCALMALEFAVEGWAIGLSRVLLVAALILAFGSRALLYALARE